jgi:2-methylisocitrate lyase-like PEP mutase family enzyme
MAQCYVGEAKNGSFDEALHRMRLYREVAHADWIQFTAPRSIDEIRRARAVVDGPFSVMESHLPAPLDHPDLLELGINLQWAPGVTHLAAQAAVFEIVNTYMQRGPVAVREFRERHADNPYITRRLPRPGRAVKQQRELESRYFGGS